MKYGKKLEVIMDNKLINPNHRYLINLDQGISEILKNKSLPPDVKIKLYTESIQKFISNYTTELNKEDQIYNKFVDIQQSLKELPLIKDVKKEVDDLKDSIETKIKTEPKIDQTFTEENLNKIVKGVVEEFRNNFSFNQSLFDNTILNNNASNETKQNLDDSYNLNDTTVLIPENKNNESNYKISFDNSFQTPLKNSFFKNVLNSAKNIASPLTKSPLVTRSKQNDTAANALDKNILNTLKSLHSKGNVRNDINFKAETLGELESIAKRLDNNIKNKSDLNKWNTGLTAMASQIESNRRLNKNNNYFQNNTNQVQLELEDLRNRGLKLLNGNGVKWSNKKFY